MLGYVVAFIPANSEKKIKNGMGFSADTLLFDLEDSVSAEKKGEEDKIFAALNKMKEEDLTFTVEKNAETGEILN